MRRIRLNKNLSYRTFPHRCEIGALRFDITEYSLDGRPPSVPETDGVVDVEDYEGWDTLSLELEVEIPEGLLGKVFPEFGEIPGMLVVAAHCRGTYLRDRLVLESDPISSGTYTGTCEFSGDAVTDAIDLRPLLVRTTDTSKSMTYAAEAGVLVADGREWRVEISDDDVGSDDVLDVRTESFESENEEDPQTRFPEEDRLYYLDLESDPERPILWLNEDHDRIVDLMRGSSEGQYDRLTGDLAWDQVMTPVWTRLVTIAAVEYDPDDEEWTPEWQAAVFDELHGDLYEDHTPEKAAERLQEDLTESTVQATKRIEDAVQGLLDPAEQFDKHVRGIGPR